LRSLLKWNSSTYRSPKGVNFQWFRLNSQRWKYAILTNIFIGFVFAHVFSIWHEEDIIQQLKVWSFRIWKNLVHTQSNSDTIVNSALKFDYRSVRFYTHCIPMGWRICQEDGCIFVANKHRYPCSKHVSTQINMSNHWVVNTVRPDWALYSFIKTRVASENVTVINNLLESLLWNCFVNLR
jgi:hypothetical protein